MTVELKIKIEYENEDNGLLCATLQNDDEIIAGYGMTPYSALHSLVCELEFQHQYFRADNE